MSLDPCRKMVLSFIVLTLLFILSSTVLIESSRGMQAARDIFLSYGEKHVKV